MELENWIIPETILQINGSQNNSFVTGFDIIEQSSTQDLSTLSLI